MPVLEEISFGFPDSLGSTDKRAKGVSLPLSTKEGFIESEPGLIADFLPKYLLFLCFFV
jgi:hypothetical protein